MRDFFRSRNQANRDGNDATVRNIGIGNITLADVAGRLGTRMGNPRIESVSAFIQGAQTVFDRVDEDGNGYLSRQEIGRAVENRNIRGEDAQVVAGLFDADVWSRLPNLSNDEWGSENNAASGFLE